VAGGLKNNKRRQLIEATGGSGVEEDWKCRFEVPMCFLWSWLTGGLTGGLRTGGFVRHSNWEAHGKTGGFLLAYWWASNWRLPTGGFVRHSNWAADGKTG